MPPMIPLSNADRARQGLALLEQGQLKQAERALKDVLKADQGQLDALLGLGVLNGMRGNDAEAVRLLSRAVARDPRSDAALYNLGQAQMRLGRFEDAVASLEKAAGLATLPHVHEKLGDCLRQLGRLEAAVGHYAKAVEQAPGNSLALSSLIELKRKLCDWHGIAELEARLVALAKMGKTVEPLLMLHVTDDPLLLRQTSGTYWHALVPKLAPAKVSPVKSGARRDRSKIRVGYLSADFRVHPMVSVIAEMIERHDRSRFDVIGLSYGIDDGSPQRRRMEAAFDRFVDMSGDSEARMVQRVADLGLDILVDLAGYTANARLGVVSARPAPIVCHYMGFPGSLGSPAYDYLIADPIVAPPGSEAAFSEAIVRLPECYWAVDTRRPAPPATTRAAHGLPRDGVVLASLNGQQKLSPALLDLWARVLAAVPGAVLWLYTDHETAAENMRREAASRGIAPERLIMAGRVPLADHLARIGLADLMLDALPYGGHTTTCDALWQGVPVLSVAGKSFAARVGASLLSNAGLAQLIMPSLAAYEVEAIALASDPSRLARLRSALAGSRQTCPLFDTARFTRHLEAAFAQMHERHLRGERPASFDVPAQA